MSETGSAKPDSVQNPPSTEKKLPYAHKGNLIEGDLTKHLIRLTLPMVWGIFIIISFQLVDMYFISLLGTKQLAAVTFTFPVTYTIFSMIMGMGISMASVLSRQIGGGDQDTVRRIATHGVFLAFTAGLILAVLGYLLKDKIFTAMGADPAMMPLIDDYINVWFAGAVFVTTPFVGNAAIRATGDTMAPAIIMTIAAIVNLILDPIMIFGLFGFPRLEIQGAAISTVFANFCAMGAGLYVLAAKKHLITRESLLHRWHLLGDSLKKLALIAVPAGITSSIQPLMNAVIISLLATYGAQTVAAYGVVTRIEAFFFVVIMALATGMAPIIGQNWGAKKFDRVNKTLYSALIFAASWSLFVAAVLLLFGKHIIGLFAEDDAQHFAHVGMLYFWIVALTYAPGNLVPGWGSAFNAMGMPQRSFMMIFVKLIVLNIPLAYAGAHFYGIAGIFGSIAITNLTTGLFFHWRNMRLCHDREEKALHPDAEADSAKPEKATA